MKFTIITLFPKQLKNFLEKSIILRAQKKKLIDIEYVNLRDFANDKHKSVDDTIYGGGTGMILKVDVVDKALEKIKKESKNAYIILLTPQGKKYHQKKAIKLANKKHLVLICGYYEGFDERIRKLVDEQISIGDYVISNGDIAASIIIDSVSRLIKGVLPKGAPENDSFMFGKNIREYPQYTKPERFISRSKKLGEIKVPKILLSGNHKEIANWRERNKK